MSRILIVLRILIIGGALASVLHFHQPAYTFTRLELVSDGGLSHSMGPVSAQDMLRLALTAISLSLL